MNSAANAGAGAGNGSSWEKLWGLVDEIKTGMLTTVDGGSLRARPMRGFVEGEAGRIWFFTRASAHKAAEIESEHQVGVAYADPHKSEYVSVSGRAGLVRDRQKIDQYWSPFVAAWFPEGKDDPDLALLRVDVEAAEYWDSPSSRMVQLAKIVQANITGRQPAMGENRKL